MLSLLFYAGWVFTLIFAAAIFVPWLKGSRHLVSGFTFFMAGSVNFLSLGMIQNARGIGLAEFTTQVQTFVLAMAVFYGCLFLVYFWPRRNAQPRQRGKWPVDSEASLRTAAVGLSIAGTAIAFCPIAFPGIQVLFILNGPMTFCGFALALILLLRNSGSVANQLIACLLYTSPSPRDRG